MIPGAKGQKSIRACTIKLLSLTSYEYNIPGKGQKTMTDKTPDVSPNVDETMKELETHGSFELPVETYTDN